MNSIAAQIYRCRIFNKTLQHLVMMMIAKYLKILWHVFTLLQHDVLIKLISEGKEFM